MQKLALAYIYFLRLLVKCGLQSGLTSEDLAMRQLENYRTTVQETQGVAEEKILCIIKSHIEGLLSAHDLSRSRFYQ